MAALDEVHALDASSGPRRRPAKGATPRTLKKPLETLRARTGRTSLAVSPVCMFRKPERQAKTPESGSWLRSISCQSGLVSEE